MKWTDEEIKILMSAKTCELAQLLPHRSWSSITSKRQKLGVKWTKQWSPEEIELLKSCSNDLTAKQINELFPGRTLASIKIKLSRNNLLRSSAARKNKLAYLRQYREINKQKLIEKARKKYHNRKVEKI